MKIVKIDIFVPDSLVRILIHYLNAGFLVKIHKDYFLKKFLCEKFEIDDQYIDHKINTIFLNCKIVDDINSKILTIGDTVALSGSMPGLVGAVLRKGSFYSVLRNENLSYNLDQQGRSDNNIKKEGYIRVKMFNLVAYDLGARILNDGVLFDFQTFTSIRENLNKFGECRISKSGDINNVDLFFVKVNTY